MNHRQIRTHKTHHGPNLGEATTFPLWYTLCLAMGLAPKWHFVSGLQSGNPEIPKIVTLVILGAHNFVCKPSTNMNFEAKL